MTEVKPITQDRGVAAPAPAPCARCPIQPHAVCAWCGADELAALEGIKFYRSFEAGQTVVWAGDRMDVVGSVVSGVASLTQTLDDGRTQMVGLLLPADFLGRPGRERAAYSVTAASDLMLCCFRRKPFEELLRRFPQLGARLLDMTLDELDAARDWLLLLGRKSARERIASFLVILARREAARRARAGAGGDPGPQGRIALELPLTREAMADYLGLTLETVSRQVSALRREGVIALEGARQVTVPDFARLVGESGDDADGGPLA